jgi:hypothetical protein
MHVFCTTKTLVCFHPVLNAVPMSDHDAKATYPSGGKDGGTFTILPKPGIQEVPDWVRDTAAFKLAASYGIVTEVVMAPAQAAAEAAPLPLAVKEIPQVPDVPSGVSAQPTGAIPKVSTARRGTTAA